MKYITGKRFKRENALGRFNISYGTEVEEQGGWLFYNGMQICKDTSAIMREYFARNDDGCGLKRFKIAHAIIDKLHIRDGESKEDWQKRWDVIWADPVSNKYRKDNSDTTFLWGIQFFNAPLLDLYHIASLVGVKEGGKTV